jgi:hypothetical protein
MNVKSKSIKYYPWTELGLFLLATAFAVVVVNRFDLSVWLSVLLGTISYFIFLGGSNLINVADDKIEITFLNLFSGRASIDFKKVKRLWSEQSYEAETDYSVENTYYVFSRQYNLEFLDEKGRSKVLNFKVNNRKKENEIVKAINERKNVNT